MLWRVKGTLRGDCETARKRGGEKRVLAVTVTADPGSQTVGSFAIRLPVFNKEKGVHETFGCKFHYSSSRLTVD